MASPTIRVTRECFRAVGTLHIVQGDRRHKREDTKGLLRGTRQLRLFALLFTTWLPVLLPRLLSCPLLLLRLCRSVSCLLALLLIALPVFPFQLISHRLVIVEEMPDFAERTIRDPPAALFKGFRVPIALSQVEERFELLQHGMKRFRIWSPPAHMPTRVSKSQNQRYRLRLHSIPFLPSFLRLVRRLRRACRLRGIRPSGEVTLS